MIHPPGGYDSLQGILEGLNLFCLSQKIFFFWIGKISFCTDGAGWVLGYKSGGDTGT